MKRKFAIIGLGRFGTTIALELARQGHEVLAVDQDRRRVDDVVDRVTHAVIASAEDERALRELDLASYDAAVVSIGENIEASILCSLLVKDLGVKEVWAKAVSHHHHRILAKLGIHRIVHPEFEMGMRVAQALNYPQVMDYISLGHDQYVVEVRASERVAGKTLAQMEYAERLHITLLSVKRDHDLNVLPPADWRLETGDQLLFVGELGNLRLLSSEL